MRRLTLLLLCLCAGFSVQAWDWFGLREYDEADTNRPPRLHVLLEKANDLIEQAEEDSLAGEGDKALDGYRQALIELTRVENENPQRAGTSEFAPVRNKKATCVAAIESIRFAQVKQNQRAVTLSDTTALRLKYNRKHGIKTAPPPAEADEKDHPKSPTASDLVAINVATNAAVDKDWKSRLKQAYGLVKARDYAAADVLLEKLLAERPLDLNALLLRAAAQCGTGSMYAARRTLEKANRAHPRSYLPYYNLAYVTLDLGEGVAAAREYYELGRLVGGPADKALAARLEAAAKPAGKGKDAAADPKSAPAAKGVGK